MGYTKINKFNPYINHVIIVIIPVLQMKNWEREFLPW